ncbi:MAG: DUF3397 family protein [Lactobacillus sp.]|jgi:hypothetical protein|nr:DUF3397 family protein [Lactobacillus sp.]
MLNIILLPLIGLFFTWLLAKIFPRAQFNATIILPLFFLPACQLLTHSRQLPSFLPYGFFCFFILVIIVSLSLAIHNKNISLGKTLLQLSDYLSLCSVLWFLGLLIIVFI